MRDDKLTGVIFSRQLVSVMNRTKWRAFGEAINSNPDFTPLVNVRFLEGYEAVFHVFDWHWVRYGDTRLMEWLDVDPVQQQHVGRLVERRQMDFSQWVRETLQSHAIPFTEIEGLFRISGYLRPAAS